MATSFYLVENNAADDLNGAVAGGDGTIELTSAAEFPATGDFLVTVWDAEKFFDPADDDGSGSGGGMEVMLCTGVAGNVLTVTRAQAGTAAVAHADGDDVQLKLMVEHLEQITTVALANEAHVAGDGSDHADIDQAVTIAGTPQFARLGVGTTAPAAGLTAKGAAAFDLTAAASHTGQAITVDSSAITAGNGVKGVSIDWTALEAIVRRFAVAAVQATVDGDQLNLIFYAHPSATGGDALVEALRITYDLNLVCAGTIDAVAGFKDNGVAGLDTTFVDADGKTFTVSGGIITGETAP